MAVWRPNSHFFPAQLELRNSHCKFHYIIFFIWQNICMILCYINKYNVVNVNIWLISLFGTTGTNLFTVYIGKELFKPHYFPTITPNSTFKLSVIKLCPIKAKTVCKKSCLLVVQFFYKAAKNSWMICFKKFNHKFNQCLLLGMKRQIAPLQFQQPKRESGEHTRTAKMLWFLPLPYCSIKNVFVKRKGAQPTTSWTPLGTTGGQIVYLRNLLPKTNHTKSKTPKWIQNHAQIPMTVAM